MRFLPALLALALLSGESTFAAERKGARTVCTNPRPGSGPDLVVEAIPSTAEPGTFLYTLKGRTLKGDREDTQYMPNCQKGRSLKLDKPINILSKPTQITEWVCEGALFHEAYTYVRFFVNAKGAVLAPMQRKFAGRKLDSYDECETSPLSSVKDGPFYSVALLREIAINQAYPMPVGLEAKLAKKPKLRGIPEEEPAEERESEGESSESVALPVVEPGYIGGP